MSKEEKNIEEPQEQPKKSRSLGRVLVRIATYTLVFFLVILTAAYFLFDRVVKITIEEQFNAKSKGHYELKIGDLETNLFKESVSIKELSIRPIGDYADSTFRIDEELNVFAFDLKAVELTIRDAERFLVTDSLTISSFGVDTVHLTYWNYKPVHEKKDPREQIQKYIASLTPDLLLDSFAIHNASLDYYTLRRPKSFEHHIANFSVDLNKVQINENSSQENLFFTPLVQIHLYDYQFRDSSNSVDIASVLFDSYDKKVIISDIAFQKLDKADIHVPRIEIHSPQVARYIYSQELVLDSLIIQSPDIKLSGISHKSSTSRSMKESLAETITKFSKELRTNNISLRDADFELERESLTAGNSRFQVEGLDIIIDDTEINKGNVDDLSRVMFSEDIQLGFQEFNFKVGKNGFEVIVGEFETDLNSDDQKFNDIHVFSPQKVDLKIASVDINQMDWRRFWDKGQIDLNSFGVKFPHVVLYTDKSKNNGKNKITKPQNLSELIVKSLPFEISLNKLFVYNGAFDQYFFGSSKGLKSQSARKVNLVLNDIHFDRNEEVQNPIKVILNDVEYLKFGQYKLTPVNDKYDLAVEGVELYPRSQDFHIDNIALDLHDKMNLQISSFNFVDLDWEAYLEDNSIDVQKVWIENPHIVADFDKKVKSKNKKKVDVKKLIPEVLLGFGSRVHIDSIHLTDGDLNLRTEAKSVFKQNVDSLNILITGFDVDSNYIKNEHLLYSEDIAISFENYTVEKDSSQFKLLVHDVEIPSRDSLIVFHDLRFRSEHGDSLHAPKLELRNIDWNKLWDKDSLEVEYVLLDSLNVDWSLTKKNENRRKKVLNKKLNLPVIIVDKFDLKHGTADLNQPDFGEHDIDKFHLSLDNFILDSNFLVKDLPFENASFEIENYSVSSDKKDIDIAINKLAGQTHDGNLEIDSIVLKNHEIDVESQSLLVNGFNLDRLYGEKSIEFNTIDLNNTEVHYIKSSHFNRIKKHDTIPFTEKLFKVVNGVYGNELRVNNMSLSAMLPESMHSFDSLYTSFRDISVSPPDLQCEDRILCSRGVKTSLKNYSYLNQKKLQQLHFASFEASSMDSSLIISDFHYSPTLEESEFLDNLRHRKTFFSVNSREMSSNSFNFYELYNSQKLLARELVVESPEMMIAENLKKARKEGKVPKMPNEMIKNLPIYVKVDEIEIHKADIVYNERSRNFQGTGSVYFTDTDVHIENVTNDSVYMTESTPAVIRAHTQFMNEGSLSVLMTVPLLSDTFSCEYQGTLGSMNAKIINEMLVPNANLGLRSGEVRRISFNAEVNNGVAKGEMLAKYRSFKVDIYSKNQKRRTIVGSWISNMVISKNNKKKKGTIYYESTPVDSFMKVLWGGIRSGLKDTLLPGFVVNKV